MASGSARWQRLRCVEPRLPGGQLRCRGAAQVARHLVAEGAARVEVAAGRRVQEAGRIPGNRDQLGAGVTGDLGHAREQPPRVGHLRVGQDLGGLAVLHGPAAVHHQGVVGHLGHHAQVVGDDDDRGVELLLEVLEQVEDLRLDGHVQRRGRLVGDQHGRVVDQPHRDHRALPHAAGELVRVVVDPAVRLRDADPVEHLDGAAPGRALGRVRVHPVGLDDLRAHREVGVQRRERVLEDHRHVAAAELPHLVLGQRQHVGAVQDDLARQLGVGAVEEAHDRRARHRLAGAGLAHDPQRLAPRDGVAQPVDGLDDAVTGREVDLEVLDDEERVARGRTVGRALLEGRCRRRHVPT